MLLSFSRHSAFMALLLATVSLYAEPTPEAATEIKDLADRIDAHIAASWRAQKVRPVEAADDATYLRRVYLDLVGQVPDLKEVRDFIDDPAADKRQRLVERLLTTDAHARHFASIFRKALLPGNVVRPDSNEELEVWFHGRIKVNEGYDKIAQAVLASEPFKVPYLAFVNANENKPENLATSTSRFFMGVRLECAQCHNHPFAKWKKEQFWEFVAFFSGGQATIPNTDTVVKPRLIVGEAPELNGNADLRSVLALQLTSPDNPYFARAAVNRLWLQFFGIGLVDPVDALGEDQPPSHPELLDELARAFVEHKYDLRFLICAITSTKTYALSSVSTDAGQDDVRLFARAAIRGLSAQQLFDSLSIVTGKMRPLSKGTIRSLSPNAFGSRTDFVTRFSVPGTPLEAEASLLHALDLMNGKTMAEATSLQSNQLLRRIVEAEDQSTSRRIEELYLLTLARRPRPEESRRMVSFVENGAGRGDAAKAMADVYWMLLNSPEFSLNH
jgi:hypothetical protein